MGKQEIEDDVLLLRNALEKLMRSYEDLSISIDQFYDIEYDFAYHEAQCTLDLESSRKLKREFTLLRRVYKYAKIRKRRLESFRSKEKELRQEEDLTFEEMYEILDPLWEKCIDIERKLSLAIDELNAYYEKKNIS